jgi:hypothetical protein
MGASRWGEMSQKGDYACGAERSSETNGRGSPAHAKEIRIEPDAALRIDLEHQGGISAHARDTLGGLQPRRLLLWHEKMRKKMRELNLSDILDRCLRLCGDWVIPEHLRKSSNG